MMAADAAFVPLRMVQLRGNSRGKKGPEIHIFTLLYVVIWVWFFLQTHNDHAGQVCSVRKAVAIRTLHAFL